MCVEKAFSLNSNTWPVQRVSLGVDLFRVHWAWPKAPPIGFTLHA